MSAVSPEQAYLRSLHQRARLARFDTAAILKRFYFCEAALVRHQAAWLPGIAPFEIKMLLPRFVWEDALTANALRERVFELKYPSRLLEVAADAPLISLFEDARHAPHAAAYLHALAHVLIPAMAEAYTSYLALADELGDGPTRRFLDVALREKNQQIAELTPLVSAMLAATPEQQAAAERWTANIRARLDAIGGMALEGPHVIAPPTPLPDAQPFAIAQVPARDARFHQGLFYWPDNVDPTYPYGDGVSLQLRSAVSHLNEVWAVETAGVILDAFASDLGWEFIADAARWLYDESRHTKMGWTRLQDWGFAPAELPLGTYIYASARDQDALYRLGMLHFFETKNIGKKLKRAEAFGTYGDNESQHDMEFDWADEGMHATYGKHWLQEIIKVRGLGPETFDEIHDRCGALVAATVASATPADVQDIQQVTTQLLAHAQTLATAAAALAE